MSKFDTVYNKIILEQSIAPKLEPFNKKDVINAAIPSVWTTLPFLKKVMNQFLTGTELKNPNPQVEWPESNQILNAFANPFYVTRSASQRANDLQEFLRSIHRNDVEKAITIAGKYGIKPILKGNFD